MGVDYMVECVMNVDNGIGWLTRWLPKVVD